MTESHIVRDPKILFGKPVIAGTRISVELILEELGADATNPEHFDHPLLIGGFVKVGSQVLPQPRLEG